MPLKSETRYTRKGKVIIDTVTGEGKDHKTINAAKRASREIQMNEDHGLGRGILQLTATKTERQEIQLGKDLIKRLRSSGR